MKRYAVEFTTAAAREIRKLDRQVARRILSQIDGLATEPRPAGCRKLVGEADAWRIRIGEYRVLYEVHDRTLTVSVVRVAHRRDVYR